MMEMTELETEGPDEKKEDGETPRKKPMETMKAERTTSGWGDLRRAKAETAIVKGRRRPRAI